jgi:LysM repeat protein
LLNLSSSAASHSLRRRFAAAVALAAWLATGPGATGGISLAEEASAPSPTDARELEFEILTQAVTALCQEIARNNSQSEELSEEGVRLRARVDSLRRELANSDSEDERLRSRAEALEKQLREVGVAVPEASADRPKGDGKSAEAPTRPKSSARDPGDAAFASAKPSPEPPRGDGGYHVVAPGETLYRIGVAYGIDYRDLASVNHINDPAFIEVGQRILIPHHAPH